MNQGYYTVLTIISKGYFTISASTCDTPEKIEAALTLLDKLNDNDTRLLVEYGLEGINWEKDADGNLVDLDVENATLAANYMGLNQMLAYIPRYDLNPSPAKNERTQAQADVYVENEKYLLNRAGYSIAGKTSIFVDKIVGDYYNILGMPISKLYSILNELGYSIGDFEMKS